MNPAPTEGAKATKATQRAEPAISLHHIPAGRPIPGPTHSVSVSIPDIHTVTAFEAGDPATLQHITRGYPRFRPHPYLTRTVELVTHELASNNASTTRSP